MTNTCPRALLLLLVATSGHAPVAAAGPAGAAGPPTLKVVQDGRATSVRDGGSIRIAPAPFALEFPLSHYDARRELFHAARIVGSRDPHVLEVAVGLRVDAQAEGLDFFGAGRGMAPDESGRYELFRLGEDANHYVVVDPAEPGLQRARLVRSLGADRSEVSFAVDRLSFDGSTWTLGSSGLRRLYVVVLLDEDLDDMIDPGELFRLTLEL